MSLSDPLDHRSPALRALLASIVESSDDAIVSKTLEGIVTSWNAGAERIFGYSREEMIGQSITVIIPPERISEETYILSRICRGQPIDHFDTVRRAKDGRLIDVSVTVSPVRDDSGRIIGASKIARDITERKRMEAQLNRYRGILETTVSERTIALEESQRKLRAAERAAALGTLAAGFGHDMSNLLLPIFARLDAMQDEELSSELRDDVRAVRSAAVYLQRLSSGLRMMAMDPEEQGASRATDLAGWWEDVEGILSAVLPRNVRLETSGFQDPLSVPIPRHRLTQAIFNLVQNAGEAMASRPGGAVRVAVRAADRDRRSGVEILVQDDGPGMSDEVTRRCFEPYFSTKARAISTGMGLSLVRSLIRAAGGFIEVASAPGRGATFAIWLPAVERCQAEVPAPVAGATVSLADQRAGAFAAAILQSSGVRTRFAPAALDDDALWVVDGPEAEELQTFLDRPGRRVVLLQNGLAAPVVAAEDRLSVVPARSAAALRNALVAAAAELAVSPAPAPAGERA